MPGSGAEDIPHVMVHDHKIQRPQKTGNIDASKGALLGLHAVNNKNPKSADQIRGYISYFEKFDNKPLYLEKAEQMLESENEIEARIHLNFVQRKFKEVADLAMKENDAISELKDAWTNYRIAKSFDELKMLNKALPYYKSAHDLMKLDLDFGSEYANALIRSKRLPEAEKLLKSQLNRAQKHPLTWINWGSVNFLNNKLTEAKRAYLKVLELEPNNQPAH
jgi:tetratricopeptide (TPR) repeat protein